MGRFRAGASLKALSLEPQAVSLGVERGFGHRETAAPAADAELAPDQPGAFLDVRHDRQRLCVDFATNALEGVGSRHQRLTID